MKAHGRKEKEKMHKQHELQAQHVKQAHEPHHDVNAVPQAPADQNAGPVSDDTSRSQYLPGAQTAKRAEQHSRRH